MIDFIKNNLNPKNKKRGDCVVRAIAHATNQSWDAVFTDLCKIAFNLKAMPNDKVTCEKYLALLGFTKHKQPRKPDNTKYTVGEIDKVITKHKIAILSVAHHLTVVDYGTVYDLWDCRNKTVGNYWTREVANV